MSALIPKDVFTYAVGQPGGLGNEENPGKDRPAFRFYYVVGWAVGLFRRGR